MDEEQSHRKRKLINVSTDDDDDDYAELGASGHYTLEKKKQTILEQEEEAENNLHDEINKVNSEIKQYNNLEFSSSMNQTNSKQPQELSNSQFFTQNIINYDDKVKIIIIGKEKVGKTLFINKLLNEDKISKPTECLEIQKAYMKIENLSVMIELLDTNENIVNDTIIQAYYRICNGYIIITRNENDAEFISKQIEFIHSISSQPNILIILNTADKIPENYPFKNSVSNVIALDISKYKKGENIDINKFLNSVLLDKKSESESSSHKVQKAPHEKEELCINKIREITNRINLLSVKSSNVIEHAE